VREVLEKLKKGNLKALIASFIYFDHSFSVWLVLGALGPFIAESLGLSGLEKGFLVAVPVFCAAVLRISLGYAFQYADGKKLALLGILLSLLPHLYLLLKGLKVSYGELLVMGVFLGVAGASFAVALPMAGSNYPKEVQGFVLGLVAAGNVGAVMDGLLFPPLARAFGWEKAFLASGLLLLIALAAVLLWAEDRSPKEEGSPLRPLLSLFFTLAFLALSVVAVRKSPFGLSAGLFLLPLAGSLFALLLLPPSFREVLRERDAWVMMLAYGVSFGGFVGMSSYVSMFLTDAYGVSKVEAGAFMAFLAFSGALVRPLGGLIADRLGGASALTYFLGGVALFNFFMALLNPPLPLGIALLLGLYLSYGLGNGAIFQLVPHRWPYKTGLMTGIIGAAGGIGGFYLPAVNGTLYQLTGSYAPAFALFGFVALLCALIVRLLRAQWMEWARVRYDYAREKLVGIDPKSGKVVMELAEV